MMHASVFAIYMVDVDFVQFFLDWRENLVSIQNPGEDRSPICAYRFGHFQLGHTDIHNKHQNIPHFWRSRSTSSPYDSYLKRRILDPYESFALWHWNRQCIVFCFGIKGTWKLANFQENKGANQFLHANNFDGFSSPSFSLPIVKYLQKSMGSFLKLVEYDITF